MRVPTGKQDPQNQQYEILEHTNRHELRVNGWMAITISSRKTIEQRRIKELLEKLTDADTLIVTELSRLECSTAEVIDLINQLIWRQIRLIVIKQNLDLKADQHDMSSKIITTIFSLLGELERDLISLRTKEALAAKRAGGVKLGKPHGTVQEGKFDVHRDRIVTLLQNGVSVRRIALNTYIKKRGLRTHSS